MIQVNINTTPIKIDKSLVERGANTIFLSSNYRKRFRRIILDRIKRNAQQYGEGKIKFISTEQTGDRRIDTYEIYGAKIQLTYDPEEGDNIKLREEGKREPSRDIEILISKLIQGKKNSLLTI